MENGNGNGNGNGWQAGFVEPDPNHVGFLMWDYNKARLQCLIHVSKDKKTQSSGTKIEEIETPNSLRSKMRTG